jgi:hypothetical protein
MKISIWRQFSSNHSGGFTVIGKFQSKEEADKLADEIRTLIKTIKEDTSSISPVIGEDDTYLTSNPPTEKEIAIANYYGIEWKIHIDWAVGDANVTQFDNYVVISDHPAQSQNGGVYIDQIVAKFTNEVYVEKNYGTNCIAVKLTCAVSDIAKTTHLFKVLDKYFFEVRAERGHLVKPPWHDITTKIYEHDPFVASDDLFYGYVHQDKTNLLFSSLKFHQIGYGLPALIAYLKQERGSNIEYTLE